MERMNAISIWARSASALQDTCKNIIFHPSAVRELEEVRWRWSGEVLERWTRGQRRGKKCLINTSCLQIFSLRKDWQRGIFEQQLELMYLCVSTSSPQGWRTAGECSGPSWLQGSVFWLVARLLPASPPGVLTCCTCLTLWSRGLVLLIHFQHESCLWSSEVKPKTFAICFMCSRLKPPTAPPPAAAAEAHNWYIHPHLL